MNTPKPRYSWLQFRCSIFGYGGPKLNKLHITIRFLGMGPIDLARMNDYLYMNCSPCVFNWSREDFVWVPDMFGYNYVLRLVQYPVIFNDLNEKTRDLFPDQYPKYQPHITVDKEYWDEVRAYKYEASTRLVVPPVLELYSQSELVYNWNENI